MRKGVLFHAQIRPGKRSVSLVAIGLVFAALFIGAFANARDLGAAGAAQAHELREAPFGGNFAVAELAAPSPRAPSSAAEPVGAPDLALPEVSLPGLAFAAAREEGRLLSGPAASVKRIAARGPPSPSLAGTPRA